MFDASPLREPLPLPESPHKRGPRERNKDGGGVGGKPAVHETTLQVGVYHGGEKNDRNPGNSRQRVRRRDCLLYRGTSVPMWSCEVRANCDGPGKQCVDAIRATDTHVCFGAGLNSHAIRAVPIKTEKTKSIVSSENLIR